MQTMENGDREAIREMARQFVSRELSELVSSTEATAEPVPEKWMRRYAELGLLGINAPESFGGLGLPLIDALVVIEEMAKASVGVAWPVFESCVGPARIVERFGSEALKERLLPGVVAGDIMIAASMSEPDAGTALTDLRTTADETGETVTINGVKRWCSGAGHADAYVVFCRMNGTMGAGGIGAVLVERDAPGLSFGATEALMGFRGVPSADIFLDEVRVPAENILVRAGGFGDLMSVFNIERCGNAAMSIGVAAGALEQVVSYVQERKQFGKPIIDFQMTQIRLAEMAMQVEAARLMLHRAGTNLSDGLPDAQMAAMAKCYANEIVRTVTGSAMQLMGGYGYARAYGMERRMRDAWGWGIAGGTIDIQKINIASGLVGRRFNQRR